jgi:hypothetical protein
MAVTFTPNIGLAKPNGAELGANWINGSQLDDDNNVIIMDKMDVNYVFYNPTVIGQTANPNVGTGTKVGQYQDFQGFVMGQFVISFFDAGILPGTGEYGFSLPFPVDGAFHSVGTALNNGVGTQSIIGEGYVYDNSSVGGSGSCAVDCVTIAGVSYARLIPETYTGKTAAVVGSVGPFSVANNDKMGGSFWYKRT